jgi:hypothetical protein
MALADLLVFGLPFSRIFHKKLLRVMPPSATVSGRVERRRASDPLDCMCNARQLDSDPVISQVLAA